MSNFALKSLLSAAALAAISVGAAEARYDPSLCQVSVDNSRDGSGLLIATAAPGVSGYYELTAYQFRPTGAIDLSQSGPVRSRGYSASMLSQIHLSTGYNGPRAGRAEGPRGVVRANQGWNDGRYGQDVSISATLIVYDHSGRKICQDGYYSWAQSLSGWGR